MTQSQSTRPAYRLAVLLALFVGATLFAGCGKTNSATTGDASTGDAKSSDAKAGDVAVGDDGLYFRTAYAFNQLQNTTFYLHGDQIAWNPEGGVDPFDFAAAQKAAPGNVGHFKINGNQMDVTWGDPNGHKTLTLERRDGKISALDGGLVSKIARYANDQKLDATYGGVLLAGGAAGITSGRSMTFTKAGTFTLSTLATAELNPDVPGGTGSVAADSKGTYSLSGNTLTLNFANGKTEKHTVFPYSTATDPAKSKLEDEKLFFDTMMLSREK